MSKTCRVCGKWLDFDPMQHYFQRGDIYWCPTCAPAEWTRVPESR